MSFAPDIQIQVPSQPEELLLSWRPPLSVTERTHWAVGRLSRRGDDATFQYLVGQDFSRPE